MAAVVRSPPGRIRRFFTYLWRLAHVAHDDLSLRAVPACCWFARFGVALHSHVYRSKSSHILAMAHDQLGPPHHLVTLLLPTTAPSTPPIVHPAHSVMSAIPVNVGTDSKARSQATRGWSREYLLRATPPRWRAGGLGARTLSPVRTCSRHTHTVPPRVGSLRLKST